MKGVLCVLLLLYCKAQPLSTEKDQRSDVTAKDYAYVTIFYEINLKDFEYFLAVRTLFRSLKDAGASRGERVVLVHSDLSPAFKSAFEADGLKLIVIDKIGTPETYTTAKRFKFSLDKLAAWTLVQYKRVIFFDADCLALQNPDFLFDCGEFCVVFFNPVRFHTSLLVITPSNQKFKELSIAVSQLESFDGADQGFLNSYYANMIAAPLFNRSKGSTQPKVPMMRIPVQHHINHLYYYETFSWNGIWGGADKIITITFPFAPFWKPWNWWSLPMFDMHVLWWTYRTRVDRWEYYRWQLLLLVLGLPLFFVVRRVAPLVHTYMTAVGGDALDGHLTNTPRDVVWHLVSRLGLARYCGWFTGTQGFVVQSILARSMVIVMGWGCSVIAMAMVLLLVPAWVRPELAWPVYMIYHFYVLWLLLSGLQALVTRSKGMRGCSLSGGKLTSRSALLYFIPFLLHLTFPSPFLVHYDEFISKLVVLSLTWTVCVVLHCFFLDDFVVRPYPPPPRTNSDPQGLDDACCTGL